MYLHSTMLLLYRMRAIHCMELWRIYIPLCFYFIHSQGKPISYQKQIYIPLCFYFIAYKGYYVDKESVDLHSTMLLLYRKFHILHLSFLKKFTFHYASTLSYSVITVMTFYFAFTFHYASTLSFLPPAAPGNTQ